MDTSFFDRVKTINELNGLIDLADKSSEKFSYLRIKKSKVSFSIRWVLIFLAIAILGFAYFSLFIYNIKSSYQVLIYAGAIIIVVASINYLLFKFKEKKEISYEIESETKILKELLQMIYGIKEIAFNKAELSSVEKAIINMKLNRIQFSTKVESKYLRF
jgi:hypothetical protein